MIYISIGVWGVLSLLVIIPYFQRFILWVRGIDYVEPPSEDAVSIWCDKVIGKRTMRLMELFIVVLFILSFLINVIFSEEQVIVLILSACVTVLSISMGGFVSFKIIKHLIRSKRKTTV